MVGMPSSEAKKLLDPLSKFVDLLRVWFEQVELLFDEVFGLGFLVEIFGVVR